MNTAPSTIDSKPSAQQEMEFRLSLLRLMTVPHTEPAPSAGEGTTQQIEALAVLANRQA